MTNLSIEKADHSLEVVNALAHEIWPHTFSEILSPDQIDYMLNMMYSLKSLSTQIEEGHQFHLIKKDNIALGYLSTQMDYQPDYCKIHKIYVHQKSQGLGLGKAFLIFAKEEALKNGKKGLILNVNRDNPAIGFYEKFGFEIKETVNIDIGSGYLMEDYVMVNTF